MVAIARKLLVVLWHVLSARVADQYAEVDAVARRLLLWGTRHSVATQPGMSRLAFVQQHLERLGMAQALRQLPYNGKVLLFDASG